jgi:hypothetical protein
MVPGLNSWSMELIVLQMRPSGHPRRINRPGPNGAMEIEMMFRSLSAVAALLMTTSLSQAAFDAQSVAAQLQSDGYTSIEIKVGQSIAKVEAIKDGVKIEVTYDIASGDVIKSETENVGDDNDDDGVIGDDDDDNDADDDHGGDDDRDDDGDDDHHGDNSGPGGGGDDDDEGDDHDDDNSGHGGGDDDGDDGDDDGDDENHSGHGGGDDDDDEGDDD